MKSVLRTFMQGQGGGAELAASADYKYRARGDWIQAIETKCTRQLVRMYLVTWSTRPTTGCGIRSIFLWSYRNLFWQLSRGADTRVARACPAPRQPLQNYPSGLGTLEGDNALTGRENTSRTTSKSGHPCHARIAYNVLPQKRREKNLC